MVDVLEAVESTCSMPITQHLHLRLACWHLHTLQISAYCMSMLMCFPTIEGLDEQQSCSRAAVPSVVPLVCLQTMDEPQVLSSAEKRRRTALAEKDFAAVISAGTFTQAQCCCSRGTACSDEDVQPDGLLRHSGDVLSHMWYKT